MNIPMPNLECSVRVLSDAGRPVVLCEALHFLPSGATAACLIAAMRPLLQVALQSAAAQVDEEGPVNKVFRLGFDIGECDPEISVAVRAPHIFLANLDGYLRRIELAVAQFAVDNVVPGSAGAD